METDVAFDSIGFKDSIKRLFLCMRSSRFCLSFLSLILSATVDAYGSVLKKYHETKEFDEDEIYPYRIEGLGKNLIPTATDFDVIDFFEKVNDEQSAHSSREIAFKEGMFVGYTSGAAMQAVKQLSKNNVFNKESIVVMIFCDHGSRYMSKIYNDKWMSDQGFFDSEKTQLEKPIEYIK